LISIRQHDVIYLFKLLAILATSFKYKIVGATDVNWCNPFSTEFSFFGQIQRYHPEELAVSIASPVIDLFYYVFAADMLGETARTKSIGANWAALSEDVAVCFNTDRNLATDLMQLAEVG
jgi:hypothetical protein